MADVLSEKKEAPPIPAAEQAVEILKMPELHGLSPTQACDRFLESEEFYVERGLRVVSETFEQRLMFHIKVGRPVINEQEIAQIFLNISNIYDFNRQLYDELRKCRLDGPQALVEGVGSIMKRHIPFFKLYTSYIKNHRKATRFLQELTMKRQRFAQFLELNNMCAGHSLISLLGVPVSRLPQYLIFLGSIQATVDQSSHYFQDLSTAINAIQETTDGIAFALRDEAARKLVVTVQERIFRGNVDLVSPHRYVVRHGDLKIVNPKSIFSSRFSLYIFILFNDFLMVATRPGVLSGKVKHVVRLEGMSLVDEPNGDDYKNAFRVSSKIDNANHLICAPNATVKSKWMEAIQEAIAVHQKTLASGAGKIMSSEDFINQIKKKTSAAGPKMVDRPQPGSVSIRPNAASPSSATSPSSTSSYAAPAAPSLPPRSAPAPPEEIFKIGDWEKLWDDSYQAYYYENLATGVTQWEEPPEFAAGVAAASAPPPPAPAPSSYAPPPAPPAAPSFAPAPPAPPAAPAFSAPAPAAPPVPPRAPQMGAAPAAPPMAPSLAARPPPAPPGAPSFAPPPPGPPSFAPAPPSPPSFAPAPPAPADDDDNSLLAQIRRGKELKKAAGAPAPPKAPASSSSGMGLNDALKNSLDRYRQFVQGDEDDIKEEDDSEWD